MSDPPQLTTKPKFVTVEFITKFKLSDHNLIHLVAIFLACMTFNVTILFTSGALGHRLGELRVHESEISRFLPTIVCKLIRIYRY